MTERELAMKQKDCPRCPNVTDPKKVCRDKRHQCKSCNGCGIVRAGGGERLGSWIGCSCTPGTTHQETGGTISVKRLA